MGKVFRLTNGQLGPHPDERGVSVQIRHRFYSSDFKCRVCECSSLRFTLSNNCMMCQRYRMELVRYYSRYSHDQLQNSYIPWPQHVPEILNTKEFLDSIVESYELMRAGGFRLLHDPCKTHGHINITNAADGSCYHCSEALKPREQAIKDGHAVYVSTSKCSGCKKLTLRDTETKACEECGHEPGSLTSDSRATPDSIMMRDTPDMVISKIDADSYGFKVFRTGEPCNHGHTSWRYVKTNGCITCLRDKR